MKPNFALSLSFEGIKLLHRAAGGWREVGEVDVTSDDLAEELAVLRKTAASLEPGGVRSKLLIPSSQIKYLTIDTVGLSEAACRKAAETALHDATPYEVAELAYDISLDGPKTHVAAVARETLAEAEAFATEHRFHPVSFVAVPDDAPYLGEPFFGPTEGAADLLEAGETVEPDGIAVVIVGAIALKAKTAQPVEDAVASEPEPEIEATSADKPAPVELNIEAPEEPTEELAKKPEVAEAAIEPAKDAPIEDKLPLDMPLAAKPVTEKAVPKPKQEVSPEPKVATETEVQSKPVAQPDPKQDIVGKPVASDEPDIQPELAPQSDPKPDVAPKSKEPEAQSQPVLEPAPTPEIKPEPVVKPAPEAVTPPKSVDPAPVEDAKATTDIEQKQSVEPKDAPKQEDAPIATTPARAPSDVIKPATTPEALDVPDAARARAMAAAAAVIVEPQKPTFSAAKRAEAPAANKPVTSTGFASRRTGPSVGAKPLGGAARGGAVAIPVATPPPDSSSLNQPATMADTPTQPKAGFFSRRKPRKRAAAPIPAPTVQVAATGTEAERMTVFGARADQIGGKPRFLGLIMTVILLVFLAGVAAWAAVFLDEGIAGLIKSDDGRTTASAPENQIDPEIIRTPDGIDTAQTAPDDTVQVAALDPVLSAEDTAVLDALQNPRPDPQRPVITEQEAAARYAVTGIWPLAPDTPLEQADTPSEPVYRSGIDANSSSTDAIALPAPRGFETDGQLAAIVSPPPFGQSTALDEAGLLIPTASGVVAPGGFTLFAASPPVKPPATLARFSSRTIVAAPLAASPLLDFRPKNRPIGLAERSERAQLGGVSRIELAAFRPSLRPRSLQDRVRATEDAAKKAEKAKQETEAARDAAATEAATAAAAAALVAPQPTVVDPNAAIQSATRLATPKSIRPDTRPRNFARIVKRAEREAPKETRVAAAAATVKPRTVSPKLPSKASVARSATVKNAINLRQVNLIGVYGKPSSRRALVRLSNGRYQKVRVGDRIDGGRVSAISDSELRYKKGSRNVVLKMP
jgi:hypothetical protein